MINVDAAPAQRDSFSVCVTARETVSDLRRFIDHYCDVGAEHIYLHFDGTRDEARDVCVTWDQDPRVTVTVCDQDFWRKVFPTVEAPTLEKKQVAVFMMTIEKNQSDWLLFCDSDEFLTADGPIQEVLAKVPSDQPGVRIRNTEAVWGVSDDLTEDFGCGFERHPSGDTFIGRRLMPYLVYGRDGALMRRCLTGYVEGKHLLRRGVVPAKMTCHDSRMGERRLAFLHDVLPEDANARIVHFDAIGSARWHRKWQSRISGKTNAADMGKSRRQQERRIAEAMTDGNGEQLFRQLYGLSRWQQFILGRFGLLTRIDK